MSPFFLARLVITALFAVVAGAGSAQQDVTIFAAASLKTALDEVADAYPATDGTTLRISYAASSALARQIQQGAPAQLFISANAAWMDTLARDGLLATGTRVDLLTNRIVLIAASDTDLSLALGPGTDLVGALGDGRLAMAETTAVPGGVYGRAALVELGLWDSVSNHIAQADNVRAALRLVALGEAPLGVVYATDAAAEPRVRVVGIFDADLHPPIVYPAAILAEGDSIAARKVMAFLTGDRAAEIFRAGGFGLTGGDS